MRRQNTLRCINMYTTTKSDADFTTKNTHLYFRLLQTVETCGMCVLTDCLEISDGSQYQMHLRAILFMDISPVLDYRANILCPAVYDKFNFAVLISAFISLWQLFRPHRRSNLQEHEICQFHTGRTAASAKQIIHRQEVGLIQSTNAGPEKPRTIDASCFRFSERPVLLVILSCYFSAICHFDSGN